MTEILDMNGEEINDHDVYVTDIDIGCVVTGFGFDAGKVFCEIRYLSNLPIYKYKAFVDPRTLRKAKAIDIA